MSAYEARDLRAVGSVQVGNLVVLEKEMTRPMILVTDFLTTRSSGGLDVVAAWHRDIF